MARPLLLNVLELLRQPGSQREVVAVLPVEDLGLCDPRLADGADVDVELRLESLTDGIIVDGSVTAPYRAECRRCLAPIDAVAVAGVRELYQVRLTDPDALPIEHDQIDLGSMVREVVLLELPTAPLCRPDCAGLCPVCGIDRNVECCECDTTLRDERWAVLDQLRSPDA